MPTVLRIIDANSNRAREALRVMEEYARFILDDAKLTQSIKQVRHDLARALSAVDGLEANRDTPGDVGTAVQTPQEYERASVAEVVIAAGKRLSEALRTLEEYGKTLGDSIGPNGFAGAIEQMRYRGYDIEQRLIRACASGQRRQWKLCVLLTESLCTHHDWKSVLRAAVNHGADCIQVREKNMDSGWLLERAKEFVRIAHEKGVCVIINDRPDIALLSGADGVHLGQTDLNPAEVRKIAGRQLLIGVSTSRLDQAKRALNDGADYCGVGPMFPTTTKIKKTIAGPAYLREYLEWNGLPHLAIGGITPENVHELIEAGVQGVAISSAVCAAENPEQAVRQLAQALNPAM